MKNISRGLIDLNKEDKFVSEAMLAGEEFVKNKPSKVLIINHFDTDGLASAVILRESLKKEDVKFEIISKQHLDDNFIDSLKNYSEELIFLVDIGANKESELSTLDKKIIILDHHNPQRISEEKLSKKLSEKIIHINPFNSGIEEQNTISGSGVVYYFCLGMNKTNKEFAHLAVLGAIGDTQERNGFKELNNNILQHASLQKTIKIEKQLKLYGLNSRPLTKVLEYSTDLMIPGVTNKPQGVLDLLRELNINPYWNGRQRKYFNLFPDEKERLTNKILELKKDVATEEILVPHYILLNERKRSFKDMKEFATIINSCGRLGDYKTAMNAMKGNLESQEKAIMNLRIYKNSIRDALQLVDKLREENETDEESLSYFHKNNLLIVDFGNKVNNSIVGVVASILARNKMYDSGTVICTLAEESNDMTKISLRIGSDSADVNLQELLQKILSPMGISSGGHQNAAGVVIPSSRKDEFIDSLKNFIL